MPESFGARLRLRREEQGIALITIAKQTKIKQSLLEGLERDDVSEWPSGLYRRAFVRAYARAIDFDPDVVLREFQEVHPEPQVDVLEAMALALDLAPVNSRPSTALRNVVGSAIGSLSRLRRGPAVDNAPADNPPAHTLPLADVAPAMVPSPGTYDPPSLPSQPAEVDRVETAIDAEVDLTAVARVCTELGRVGNAAEMQSLLQEAARILEATGLIVWLWDPSDDVLKPVLVHGYSDQVVGQLPAVRRHADNATAAAFRSAQMCAVGGSRDVSGALVVPLLTPLGCTGVLALELQRGREQANSVRAIATVLASLLAQITHSVAPAEVNPSPAAESPRWGAAGV